MPMTDIVFGEGEAEVSYAPLGSLNAPIDILFEEGTDNGALILELPGGAGGARNRIVSSTPPTGRSVS